MVCIPGTDVQCSKGIKTNQFHAYKQKLYELNNQWLMTKNEAMWYEGLNGVVAFTVIG